MDSTLNKVQAALNSHWLKPRLDNNTVMVPTTCMYPSGSWVCVYVMGGQDSFTLHDGGGALWDASETGITVKTPATALRHVAEKYGVTIGGTGAISIHDVSESLLAPTLSLIANASAEAAQTLFDNNRPKMIKAAREQLRRFLDQKYKGHIKHEQKLTGESQRLHKFEHLVTFGNEQRMILDFTSPDANAVNARVVAHMDIRRAQHKGLAQKIIYDEADNWDESLLALLKVGASTVPLATFMERKIASA